MARRASLTTYRRSPHLVTYWQDRWLIAHNYATHAVALLPPGAIALLDFFTDWQTAAHYAAASGVTRTAAQREIDALVDQHALESSQRAPSPAERAMAQWERWNPAAGFFHSATRDVRFATITQSSRRLRRKAREQPPPSPVKRYRGARSVALPRVAATSELPRVLLERRTWRRFSKKPLPLASLATLLGLTGGVHDWLHIPGQGELPLTTSPSGGARNPIELYVWVRRVTGLAPGFYHYAADRHRLELLKRHGVPVSVQRYIPTQYWFEGAAALVFFSAVFERYQWKYRYARAYRASLIEAGHRCQSFCLAATWLALAPFCTMALADSDIDGDLGLDGVSESVLYAAGVGVRPRGDAVRSTPEGFAPARITRNHRVFSR